ncbi:MAG: aminotransferase class I and II [Rhodothermales bacterium]
MPLFQHHNATRYVVPLREGGSLPAIVETATDDLFVVKFRGAGQGARALIAELLAGGIAQHLGFRVPELALVDLADTFGRTERDPEIQDLLQASRGVNVGLRFMEGALNFDPLASAPLVDPEWAAEVVWLDAFVTNIDRTPRNPNMMIWDEQIWLIDHGATLYFHHNWDGLGEAQIHTPFAPIHQHVLLPHMGDLNAADVRLTERLSAEVFARLLAAIPDALFMDAPEGRTPPFPTADANRAAYADVLARRLHGPRTFVAEAIRAQQAFRDTPSDRLNYRR